MPVILYAPLEVGLPGGRLDAAQVTAGTGLGHGQRSEHRGGGLQTASTG